MKRYHDELHVIRTRARMYRALAFFWGAGSLRPPPAAGRFRKGLRCAGCGNARCQLCHPYKFPRRVPTRQERLAAEAWAEAQFS